MLSSTNKPIWATERESEEEFQTRLDAQWEEWWNSLENFDGDESDREDD
jgi:hypothetical protein